MSLSLLSHRVELSSVVTVGAENSLQLAGQVLSQNSHILLLKQEGEISVDKHTLSPRPPVTWVFPVVNK